MFAPPPIQLSRAEIERLKLEREARLAQKAEKDAAEKVEKEAAKAAKVAEKEAKAAEKEARAAAKKKRGSGGGEDGGGGVASSSRLFSLGGKGKLVSENNNKSPISSPVASDPTTTVKGNSTINHTQNRDGCSPVPFAERPRRAPVPPPTKRPNVVALARPPRELFLPPMPGAYPLSPSPTAESAPPEHPTEIPPPIPRRSPRRWPGNNNDNAICQPQSVVPEKKVHFGVAEPAAHSFVIDDLFRVADQADDRPAQHPHASNAPAAARWGRSDSLNEFRAASSAKAKRTVVQGPAVPPATAAGKNSARQMPGVQGGKIEKVVGGGSARSNRVAASVRAALQDVDSARGESGRSMPRQRQFESASKTVARVSNSALSDAVPVGLLQRHCRVRSEMVSMLLDTGFISSRPAKVGAVH